MKQTNVCLNRVFKVDVSKICIPGLTQAFVLAKKVCDENRKKETKKER